MTRSGNRWLVDAFKGWLRLHRATDRTLNRATQYLAGLVWSLGASDGLDHLNVDAHETAGGSWTRVPGLFPWERELYDMLPEPPARVLVTAAGTGREAAVLIERGYQVDAFEPAAAFEPRLKATVAPGRTWRLTHQAWIAGEGPQQAQYDAVILGWGSLSLLHGADERKRLLATCERVLKSESNAPILASYYREVVKSRALLAGTTTGRRLGGRGFPPSFFRPHIGFAVAFGDEDIVELGREAGRRSHIFDGTFGCVAWTRL